MRGPLEFADFGRVQGQPAAELGLEHHEVGRFLDHRANKPLAIGGNQHVGPGDNRNGSQDHRQYEAEDMTTA